MPGTMTPNKSTHAPIPGTKHYNLDTLSNSLLVFTIHPTITDIIFPLNILLKGPGPALPRTHHHYSFSRSRCSQAQARVLYGEWDSYIRIMALRTLHHLGLGTPALAH